MEAVRSEDDADYLYTRFHVDVTATLNPRAMSYPVAGQSPAETLVAIRELLLQDRQQLIITDNGGTVIQCPEPGFPCDVANGPIPRRCEITKFTGSKTWILRWVCDFAVIECGFAGNASGVISNRYTQSHVINQYHTTTRTTVGKMRFRSDVLQSFGVFAHELFGKVQGASLPDALPGFQRESVDITVDSNGLGINYRVRDVEKIFDKGEDGANFGGSGIIRLDGSAGVMSISSKEGIAAGNSLLQIDIRAWGNKYSNQWTMMQRCFQIIVSKIGNNAPNPVGYVVNAALRESMGEDDKWVDVSMTFMQGPIGSSAAGAIQGVRLDSMMIDVFDVMDSVFGDQAGRNPGLPNSATNPGTRGTADVTAMTAALKAACAAAQDVGPGGITTQPFGDAPAVQVPQIRVAPTPNVPDRESLYQGAPGFNPEVQNTPTPYTHYRGSIETEVICHNLMVPTTGPPPGSGGSGSGGSEGAPPSGPGSPQWTWPSAHFAMSSPTAKMRVEFQAERIGTPPAIPTFQPNQPSGRNLSLSMYRIQPSMPEVWIDGSTLIYTVNGYLEFDMALVPQDGGNIPLGVLPWTQLTFNNQFLSLSDVTSGGSLAHGIYDPA